MEWHTVRHCRGLKKVIHRFFGGEVDFSPLSPIPARNSMHPTRNPEIWAFKSKSKVL